MLKDIAAIKDTKGMTTESFKSATTVGSVLSVATAESKSISREAIDFVNTDYVYYVMCYHPGDMNKEWMVATHAVDRKTGGRKFLGHKTIPFASK